MAIAEMHDREVKGAEAPFGHHFHEPAFTKQLRLHDRGQVSDAAACKQRGGEAGEVVHREAGLERQRFLVLPVRMRKGPVILRIPIREGE